MENASKALLIAGGVLIAILVLTVGVYYARDFANNASRIYDDIDYSEVTEFNQQFLDYEGKDDLNIVDVVTIINLAKDSDGRNDLLTYVTVKTSVIDGVNPDNAEEATTEQLNRFMIEKVENTFTCAEIKINESGFVYEITITQN